MINHPVQPGTTAITTTKECLVLDWPCIALLSLRFKTDTGTLIQNWRLRKGTVSTVEELIDLEQVKALFRGQVHIISPFLG